MTIAVDTEHLKEEPGNFLNECLQRIIPLSPQHTFILFANNNLFISYKSFTNCVQISFKKSSYALFSTIEINRIIRSHKISVLITGNRFRAAFVKCKICFLTPSLLSIFKEKSYRFFTEKLFKIAVKKAALICTAWETEKKKMTADCRLNAEIVQFVHYGLNEVQPTLNNEERETAKSKYAYGNEYFLLSADSLNEKDVISFLKAFSIFKKKLKSAIRLLIIYPAIDDHKEGLSKLLSGYKFKDDVIIIQSALLATDLFKGAYAIVFLGLKPGSTQNALKALTLSTPVLCISAALTEEIFEDAALYFKEVNAENIAEKLSLIYKDEILRKSLINASLGRHAEFSWDASAGKLQQSIEKAFG